MIRLCRRAVEIDPNYAQAWALMALGRGYQRYVVGAAVESGLEEAERAIALNDGLAEGHAARAWILVGESRLEEAAVEAELALRLDPESHEAHEAAALMMFRQNRLEEAAKYWERAVLLIEQDTASPGMLVTCYHALGRPEDVRRAAEIELARAQKVLASDRNNGRVLGHGSLALAALGQADRAREFMNRALLIDPDNVNMRYNFACTLATFLKSADAALEMLAPAFRTGGAGLINHAKVDPDLDAIRDDPRYKAMLAEAEARLAKEAAA
jgi:adenylate cyclase